METGNVCGNCSPPTEAQAWAWDAFLPNSIYHPLPPCLQVGGQVGQVSGGGMGGGTGHHHHSPPTHTAGGSHRTPGTTLGTTHCRNTHLPAWWRQVVGYHLALQAGSCLARWEGLMISQMPPCPFSLQVYLQNACLHLVDTG